MPLLEDDSDEFTVEAGEGLGDRGGKPSAGPGVRERGCLINGLGSSGLSDGAGERAGPEVAEGADGVAGRGNSGEANDGANGVAGGRGNDVGTVGVGGIGDGIVAEDGTGEGGTGEASGGRPRA